MTNFDITNKSSFLNMEVTEALRTVIDPELHINIIDLGLVYDVSVNDSEKQIVVVMTLSSKYCPMGDAILNSVKNCLEHNFPAFSAEVKLTWEPEWSYDNITEEGLRQLKGY
ncbi:metal-sulfur cluster biosynthetic enzyme [Arcticibacter tournemirensis]|uniref:Metal-sulfur cluster assembly factor n=1 Tax=Arcticibacter tournemirensis TaxID=699437 RepID=A0A5M9HHU3_9SPHI|nr:metal-sulfur cluster assembly factor [Arcticibacter tournemirensis]KAA8484964.1 metal-sulfur cluster assembly factor [Arcticibacter tournemirensis]TQM50593.1 metal-sulfur cluster biosynthetic enzyme [Arcticibacter tournemirensis]